MDLEYDKAPKRLSTRITEETHRRLKVQAVLAERSMEEIIEDALRAWLVDVETSQRRPQQEEQA